MQLRDYQGDSVQAVFDYWAQGGGNPLVEMATGLGKSVSLAELVFQIAQQYPNLRMLMLTHVKELIAQNYRALIRHWPQAPAGIYNAGLGRKDFRHQIVYGSIQSVARNAELLAPRHVVFVDEAHLVSPKVTTQYQHVFKVMRQAYPQMRVVGLTATPYRLDTGTLIGEGQLFDDIVYKYNVADGIRDGWLTPVTSKSNPRVSIDTSKVSIRGGEFLEKELIEAAGDPAMILAACTDMLKQASDRKSVLVFCTGVAHAAAVAECLRVLGETAEVITGNTPDIVRDRIINQFKAGDIRFLTNANVLTTGFDAPELSCVALMRPTLSTALYVQMIGRGTRVTETIDINSYSSAEERRYEIENSVKPDCLVLDYAGNLQRHGPLNLVTGKQAKVRRDEEAEGLMDCSNPDCKITSEIAAWEKNAFRCPECNSKKCKHCGEWSDADLWGGVGLNVCPLCDADENEKIKGDSGRVADHEVEAVEGELIADVAREKGWRRVEMWDCAVHSKKMWDVNSIDTLRVTYFCSHGQRFQEWLCFDHPKDGYPYRKAAKWWKEHRGNDPIPTSVREAHKRFPVEQMLAVIDDYDPLVSPHWIVVEREGKFDKIVDRSFEEELNEKRVGGALW